MPKFKTLDDLDATGKTVLVRIDINVPVQGGKVTDTTRIDRVVPTINEISNAGGKAVLLAHFGRPKGQYVPEMSLRVTLPSLEGALGKPVTFVERPSRELLDASPAGSIILIENTRFAPGEENNDQGMSEFFASLGDAYVNDAFSCSHRAHASTEGIARLLPAYAGRTMQAELDALQAGLGSPEHPVMAIVGGAKISTKLDLLKNLVEKVDMLVIGGGMANTFLAAKGADVGKSLCEHDLADTAREIMAKAAEENCEILLPIDVVVAGEFAANAENETVGFNTCPADKMILDAGPQTVANITEKLGAAKTLIWNGPLGAFEIEPFDAATVAVAKFAAEQTKAGELVSVGGGGDTVSALNQAGVATHFTYVSTAGGAFLEWMEGKELPGVKALEETA